MLPLERHVVADRFELEPWEKFRPRFGRDRLTGERVCVVDVWPCLFLDRLATRASLEVARAIQDPVLVPALRADPLVFAAPEDSVALAGTDLVDAAIDVACAVARATDAGIAVEASAAWITTDGVRLPAPSGTPGLHTETFRGGGNVSLWSLQGWLRSRAPHWKWVDALPVHDAAGVLRSLAERAGSAGAERAREAARGWRDWVHPLIDFDRAIALGEEARGGERWTQSYVDLALAAVYHHRGCVRWRDGDAAGAHADLRRAITLDPHCRYLTSAALMATGREAAALHDRAVAAIPVPEEVGDGIEVWPDLERPEQRDRDAARTLLARAVQLVRDGRRPQARADLEASLARQESEVARRWLRKLG